MRCFLSSNFVSDTRNVRRKRKSLSTGRRRFASVGYDGPSRRQFAVEATASPRKLSELSRKSGSAWGLACTSIYSQSSIEFVEKALGNLVRCATSLRQAVHGKIIEKDARSVLRRAIA